MEKQNNFKVSITDVRTGEEKYVGLSNCIFLACYEDFGTRLIRLSECSVMDKASCYASVKFGLEDTFKDEPVVEVLVNALSSDNFTVLGD